MQRIENTKQLIIVVLKLKVSSYYTIILALNSRLQFATIYNY